MRYAAGIAFVDVELPSGDRSIGTAFHVGEGLFVTARHVVEGVRIVGLGTTQRSDVWGDVAADGSRPVLKSYRPADGTVVGMPMFHPDSTVDVALLRVEGIDAPALPLGSHLDDWFGQEMVLMKTIVLGYPPVPMSKVPILIASGAEVSAVFEGGDRYPRQRHPHFLLSAMARGGFSGGPALVGPDGWVLGLVTESLQHADKQLESGFLTLLTVEPILDCMAHHKVMPACVREPWDVGDGSTIWDRT